MTSSRSSGNKFQVPSRLGVPDIPVTYSQTCGNFPLPCPASLHSQASPGTRRRNNCNLVPENSLLFLLSLSVEAETERAILQKLSYVSLMVCCYCCEFSRSFRVSDGISTVVRRIHSIELANGFGYIEDDCGAGGCNFQKVKVVAREPFPEQRGIKQTRPSERFPHCTRSSSAIIPEPNLEKYIK